MLPKSIIKYGLRFFEKTIESGAIVNKDLAEELQKPVIKKVEKRKFYVRFKDNILVGNKIVIF